MEGWRHMHGRVCGGGVVTHARGDGGVVTHAREGV